jgi:hypothetical protein
MPEKLDMGYLQGEEERQRLIARYRMNVWEYFKRETVLDDDELSDPPYRQDHIMMMRMAAALIYRLEDDGAMAWFTEQIHEHYNDLFWTRYVKKMEEMLREACKEAECKDKEVRSYLKSVQCDGKL